MVHKRLYALATLVYIILLALVESATAEQQNITIDDAYSGGEIGVTLIYLPDGGWSQGNLCIGCTAHPDPSQTFSGTWHDSTSFHNDTSQRSIGFNFTGKGRTSYGLISPLTQTLPAGISIYVYFVIRLSSRTNITFTMDGEQSGAFVNPPSHDSSYEYSVPVFSATNLENAPHVLNISTTGAASSLMLFDYFNYTYSRLPKVSGQVPTVHQVPV